MLTAGPLASHYHDPFISALPRSHKDLLKHLSLCLLLSKLSSTVQSVFALIDLTEGLPFFNYSSLVLYFLSLHVDRVISLDLSNIRSFDCQPVHTRCFLYEAFTIYLFTIYALSS